MSDMTRLVELLAEAAETARKILQSADGSDDGPQATPEPKGDDGAFEAVCVPRVLSKKLLIAAADVAIKINPVNAPHAGPMMAMGDTAMDPMFIAVLTSKYWSPQPRTLTVSFMEATPSDLRARIVSHMNAWADGTPGSCINFAETRGVGEVRISREPGGYYSYLGTDILSIPRNRQTMNLERFTMQTPDSEFFRVVRHETGHTLGFPHEHMRRDLVELVDPEQAIAWFGRTQGWDRQTVMQQVLTPLDEGSLMSTPADQMSIMCYQLPGSITRNRKPITGGVDINETDRMFAAKIYPKAGGNGNDDIDWLV